MVLTMQSAVPVLRRSDDNDARTENAMFLRSLRPNTWVIIIKNGKPGHHDITTKSPELKNRGARVSKQPVWPSTWMSVRPIGYKNDVKVRTSQVELLQIDRPGDPQDPHYYAGSSTSTTVVLSKPGAAPALGVLKVSSNARSRPGPIATSKSPSPLEQPSSDDDAAKQKMGGKSKDEAAAKMRTLAPRLCDRHPTSNAGKVTAKPKNGARPRSLTSLTSCCMSTVGVPSSRT